MTLPPRRRRPPDPLLAPVIKTDMRRRINPATGEPLGRPECWGARTADGVWDFTREESAGTPWLITHRETRTVVGIPQGSLRACRWYAGHGHAAGDLARLQAHDRGEHAAARDPYCGRC